MTEETTTEQLAEIEGQAESTPVTEYTPPEGWRVLAVGEVLQPGDVWVNHEGESRPTKRVGERVNDELYIRCDPIEPEPQPEPQPEPIQVREGRWRTRHGAVKNIRPCEPLKGAYYVWPWTDGIMTFQDNGLHQGSKESPNDLVEYLGPIQPQPEPQPEPEPIQVREGRWRTRNGLVKDVTAMPTDHEDFSAAYPWWDGVSTWRNDGRWLAGGSTMDLVECLGPIEQQPQPEPEPQSESIQVREGRWRTRGGEEIPVTAMPTDHVDFSPAYPWWCGDRTWSNNGNYSVHENAMDLVDYIGPIAQEPEPQPQQAAIDELRSEVSYVQRLLGESRQRVTQLEELVHSLRAINEAQEKAFTAAGKENNALRNQLAAVASVAADRQRLLIELDAAQQVPADSPELRQLRLDLAEATRDRDQYLDSYQRIFGDLETIRETTKAETVEAIVEWLQAFRGCNSPALALLLIEALPSIMRSLTGLDSHEEIE